MSYTLDNEHIHDTSFRLVKNTIPPLKRRFDRIEVAGRDGSLFVDRESYEDRLIECEHISATFKESDYGNLFSFFDSKKELIFETDPAYKWLVEYIELGDVELESNVLYKVNAEFHCHPFRKKVVEQTYSISNTSVNIQNTGVTECFPNLEIVTHDYMNDVSVTVNGSKFTIHDVKANYSVNVIGDAKNVVQNGRLLETSGDFPKFVKGSNTVSTDESSKEIKIRPNERFA